MQGLRSAVKAAGIPALLHPLRGTVTWAFQRGFLPPAAGKYLPWSWTLEPFTIYGDGWQCKWFPTEFDSVGHRLFWSGLRLWERETSPVILDNIRRSRCFVDIGANCGIYTVLGCTISPTVRVVAVEPVPKVFAALANNVSKNGLDNRVMLLNLALSDAEGVVPFHEAEDATMGSLAVDGYLGQKGNVIQVECRTLDSVVAEYKLEPDFIKMDVEGFEHSVLSGARMTLERFSPRIVLEANPGDPGDAMTEILSVHGYEFHNITAEGPVKLPAIVPNEHNRNWLCVPQIIAQ